MIDELKNEGIDVDKQLFKLYGPVGLDLGAETPEEIALTVVSEIQSVLHEGTGKHLCFQDRLMPASDNKEIKESI